MSSDDGVYVLVLRNMFLVQNSSAIENINWSHVSGERSELVPTSVLWYFRNARRFSEDQEQEVARYSKSQDHYTEYGVRYIRGYSEVTMHELNIFAQAIVCEELEALRKENYASAEQIAFFEHIQEARDDDYLQNEYGNCL